jgi:translation initiation factor 2 beta subunit (eIF-2beta)/eIF-5
MTWLRQLFCTHEITRLTRDERGLFTKCYVCGHTRPILGQETK